MYSTESALLKMLEKLVNQAKISGKKEGSRRLFGMDDFTSVVEEAERLILQIKFDHANKEPMLMIKVRDLQDKTPDWYVGKYIIGPYTGKASEIINYSIDDAGINLKVRDDRGVVWIWLQEEDVIGINDQT